jgi:hypothetical protein
VTISPGSGPNHLEKVLIALANYPSGNYRAES